MGWLSLLAKDCDFTKMGVIVEYYLGDEWLSISGIVRLFSRSPFQ